MGNGFSPQTWAANSAKDSLLRRPQTRRAAALRMARGMETGGRRALLLCCARDRSVEKKNGFFFREICCCGFCLLSLSGVCGEKTFSTVVGAYSRAHALEIVFIFAPCLSLVGGTVLVFSNNQYDLVDKDNSWFFCLLANGRWSILVIFLGKK